MRVACLPFDVGSDAARNLEVVERGLRVARERGVELVVLPEMWPTSFPAGDAPDAGLLAANEDAVCELVRWTRELGLAVAGSALAETGSAPEVTGSAPEVTGSAPARAESEPSGRQPRDLRSAAASRAPALPVNRWHLVDRGTLVSTYDKVHLFTPTAEDESFAPGADRPRGVATSVGRVGGIVCYDLRFPEIARGLFRDGVEILAVSAQWPAPRASHWRALCAGRAVEAQAWVVACNRSGRAEIGRRRKLLEFPGDALVVDPHGVVLAEGRGDGALLVTDVDLEVARKLRVQVPVAKDERRDRYAAWSDAALTEGRKRAADGDSAEAGTRPDTPTRSGERSRSGTNPRT